MVRKLAKRVLDKPRKVVAYIWTKIAGSLTILREQQTENLK